VPGTRVIRTMHRIAFEGNTQATRGAPLQNNGPFLGHSPRRSRPRISRSCRAASWASFPRRVRGGPSPLQAAAVGDHAVQSICSSISWPIRFKRMSCKLTSSTLQSSAEGYRPRFWARPAAKSGPDQSALVDRGNFETAAPRYRASIDGVNGWCREGGPVGPTSKQLPGVDG